VYLEGGGTFTLRLVRPLGKSQAYWTPMEAIGRNAGEALNATASAEATAAMKLAQILAYRGPAVLKVKDLEGDVSNLEPYDIPPELRAAIENFLRASVGHATLGLSALPLGA